MTNIIKFSDDQGLLSDLWGKVSIRRPLRKARLPMSEADYAGDLAGRLRAAGLTVATSSDRNGLVSRDAMRLRGTPWVANRIAPDNAGRANDSLGDHDPRWTEADDDSDWEWPRLDPTINVPVNSIPRSRDFDEYWGQLSCMDHGDRVFRHTRHNVVYGDPRQLWTCRCAYYRQQVRIRGIELSWAAGPRCGVVVSIFCAPPAQRGSRAADMVREPNLGWTTDRRTQTYAFTGEHRIEVCFPEQSFSLRNDPRGSRILYVVGPRALDDETARSRLLDTGDVCEPAPFYRLRILYGVPLTPRGRVRYSLRPRGTAVGR